MIPLSPIEVSARRFITLYFLEHGFAPTARQIASFLDMPDASGLLRSLAENRALVLHPHQDEIWVAHPFSAAPTLFWVQGRGIGWWSNCCWCAYGIAAMAGDCEIHCRWGGEAEPAVLRGDTQGFVHMPFPLNRLWDNVHYSCALMLPFRSRPEWESWCERHRAPRGHLISLETCRQLAASWYGQFLKPSWNRPSYEEAVSLLRSLGLAPDFSALE